MAVYLDASVLVALIAREPLSERLTAWLQTRDGDILVADFAVSEASAALAQHRRAGVTTLAEAEDACRRLDSWTSTFADPISVAPSDIKTATSWVRRTDFALRAPDAIHVAAARRLDLVLVTLDHGTANAARMLGVACINPAESSA